MKEIEIVTWLLIITNGIVTYIGLKDIQFFSKFLFNVDQVLVYKDYKRLITSGFLHVNWMHFGFNMITLYLFSEGLETSVGIVSFLIIYFASLIGGNVLALFIHKHHPDYSAVGASGAISGLVFASIGLFPGLQLGFLLLPFYFPAWFFGIGYVIYSIYGIKAQKDNIGHEAHLGGGIVGLLVAIMISPGILTTNLLTILIILIPSIVFLYFIIKKPQMLLVANPFAKSKNLYTIEDKYASSKVSQQKELDGILDKINKKGYHKLSKKEKEKLQELSK
ncbi:rhomboid family intramembrane serine protease [Zhouia sp. PK063]|uniref:rhomboid family intramembrane serine protease n=1 Tax=Zhouia sp. PK063 TaxID=3373602 RepID=UPI00378AEF69